MGLFSGLSTTRQESSVTFSPAEAFAAITLATVAADGYLSDDEVSGNDGFFNSNGVVPKLFE